MAYISVAVMDRHREVVGLRAEQTYHEAATDHWAYSPDGEGLYWYETLHELRGQHG